eukprot:COSAG01_NODE_67436_length_267_cov_0.613095_1_plen_40_part_10
MASVQKEQNGTVQRHRQQKLVGLDRENARTVFAKPEDKAA